MTAVSQIRSAISGTTLRTLFSSFLALLNLALLFYYSPPLAGLACGTALVTGVVSALSVVLLLRHERALQHLQGEIYGAMVQLIQGVTKLRVAPVE